MRWRRPSPSAGLVTKGVKNSEKSGSGFFGASIFANKSPTLGPTSMEIGGFEGGSGTAGAKFGGSIRR